MKKILFLGCVLFISVFSSCGGGASKATKAAAAAGHIINETRGSNVSFKHKKGQCQNEDTFYKRISASNKNCYYCGKSWNDHIGATGPAPDNWD